jgi:hypothetical protein
MGTVQQAARRRRKKLLAFLDYRAGVVWEGEAPPEPNASTLEAIRVWNFIADGMGGVRWDALPLALEFNRVPDAEETIVRLLLIKSHNPKREPRDDED